MTLETRWIKLVSCWIGVFLIRLIPFRPPNFEPMLATAMPLSKRFGAITSFLFSFFGIVLFDAVTSGIGMWTVETSLTYGIIGVASYFFFKNRKASRTNFLVFGVIGTLFYDAITGLTIGPLFFHQSFMVALIGQIPFTALHLLGTVAFTLAFSTFLYKWVVPNEYLRISLNKENSLQPVQLFIKS
jgi:hypothetical protein